MKPQHTPTLFEQDNRLWTMEKDGTQSSLLIIDRATSSEVNVIVKAVNMHDELIHHIKDLIEQINQFPQISKGINTKYALEALSKAESE